MTETPPRRPPLASLMALVALAGLGTEIVPPVRRSPLDRLNERHPVPPPTRAPVPATPRSDHCKHGVHVWSLCRECRRDAGKKLGGVHAAAIDRAAERRERKAARLEELAKRGAIRKASG